MLLLILFCKLIEAVTDSEKKAIAALTNEFLEPFSAMTCQENPNPDVFLWNNMGDPETQSMPTYELITRDNYKEKLKNKTNLWIVEMNEVSHEDKINVQKIKRKKGEGATVLSIDPCLRHGHNSNSSVTIVHSNKTDFTKVSKISLIAADILILVYSVCRKLSKKKCLEFGRRD